MGERMNKALNFVGFGKDDNEQIEYEDYYDDAEEEFDVRRRTDKPERSAKGSERYAHNNTTAKTVYENRSYDNEDNITDIRSKQRTRLTAVSGASGYHRMVIHTPDSYQQAQELVKQLKQNKQVIIKLDNVDTNVAQRILDFLSGACFAMDCQVVKIAKGIYLFASNDTMVESDESNTATSDGDNFTDTFN